RSSVPTNHCRTDRRRNVIVPGRYISYQWTERIEWRFMTHFALFYDLHLNLIEGNVTGSFNHHLNIVFPCLLCKFAQSFQFSKLRLIACVCYTSRPQTIPQREADIVLLEDLANLLEALIKKVLAVVFHHPLCQNCTTSAHYARDPLCRQWNVLN